MHKNQGQITSGYTWNGTAGRTSHNCPHAIYTDGSVQPDGGTGWSWYEPSTGRWSAGSESNLHSSTRSEIIAALQAVHDHRSQDTLCLYTDHQQLAVMWARHQQGLKISKQWKEPISELAEAAGGKQIRIHWIRGHANDRANRFADRLAYHAARVACERISGVEFAGIVNNLGRLLSGQQTTSKTRKVTAASN